MRSDAELIELAKRLNQELGRPPKTQELVEKSGGCQRQRAIRAIQVLRTELAEKAVRSQLVIPALLQEEIRTLSLRWLDFAAAQLAEGHADMEAKLEKRFDAFNEALAEKNDRIAYLQDRLKNVEHLQQELLAGKDKQNREIESLRRERDQATALANERQRLLDTLLRNHPVDGTAAGTSR